MRHTLTAVVGLGFALLLGALWLSKAPGQVTSQLRTWTDTTGKYQVEAVMLQYKEGKVRLRRADGKELEVSLGKLSRTDRQYVQREVARHRQQAADTAVQAKAATAPASWSQWRGPNRDGVCSESGLLDSWPKEGPPLVWQALGLGRGYSSVSVSDGKIFTMGKRGNAEQLIALDQSSGAELWAAEVGPASNAGPNCTPTVDGDLVFGISHGGDLLCAESATGRALWRKNFARDFGGRMMSGWGYSESPLVDGDTLVCTPGAGQAMIAALDKRSGHPIWTTAMPPDPGPAGRDGAAYSSIVVSNAAGVRQYVQLVGRGVIGVSAEDGRFLWGYNRIANGTANIPTPIVKGDYVFCSTGYGDGGSALLRLVRRGGGVAVQEVYYLRANQVQNHHGGMILLGDHIYLGHGHNNGFPLCIELMSGRDAWRPGRGPGSGSAAVVYADGHLYFRYENAVMALIQASPEAYQLKGTFKIASQRGKSWPHPVIAGGRLYLRDQDALLCYDIRAEKL